MSSLSLLLFLYASLFNREKFTVLEDLADRWMIVVDGNYAPADEGRLRDVQTIYFTIGRDQFSKSDLRIASSNTYFLFVNGKVSGKYEGIKRFSLDSLAKVYPSPSYTFAIHQDRINRRDLVTEVISDDTPVVAGDDVLTERPYLFFRDFVVMAGLAVILFFLIISRFNPKLAADYFSPTRIISQRDTDDSQASARLTSGANVQFYVLCSLLIAYYLIIVFYNLPSRFALPANFQANGFWPIAGQWLKLAVVIFLVLLVKIAVVYGLTRLFDMRGMARIHYFNFVRLLLLVFGASSVILFAYYIGRGNDASVFTVFLGLVVVALILWVVLAFFKLSGRTGHSLFHLFSYLCATEIIPLLVTAKVLFQ